MIKLENIHKSFGTQDVLKGISLDIPEQGILVVVGKSGEGKSVLLKTIIGLLKPEKGRVIVDGSDIAQMKRNELFETRKKFGMLFQGAALFDSLSVEENLGLALKEHTGLSIAEIKEQVSEKLSMVGLEDIQKLYPSELSGGMKKRVGLARALMMNPRYMLFDEPTTGLDPVMARSIDKLITETTRHEGMTSIVVTHDMTTAFSVGSTIAMLANGYIEFTGNPGQFRESDNAAVKEFISSVTNN